MEYILVFDVGNTNIVVGLYNKTNRIDYWRVNTNLTKTADEFFVDINTFIHIHNIDVNQISIGMISSVVPKITSTFTKLFQKFFECNLININALSDIGLKFLVPNPSYIGADLVLNSYASVNKYKTNTIVCDLGTATTIQLTSKDGTLLGYAIIPGINTSSKSLVKNTAQLANINFELPENILGTNTKDAFVNGIIRGHAYMLDSFISDIVNQYKLDEYKVIITGGLASSVAKCCKNINVIDDNLIIDGLYKLSLNYL